MIQSQPTSERLQLIETVLHTEECREHGQTVEALRDTLRLAHSQKKVVHNAKIIDRMFAG